MAGADLRHEAPSHTIPHALRYWSVFQVAIKHTVSKQRISLRIHHNGKVTEALGISRSQGWHCRNDLTCCDQKAPAVSQGSFVCADLSACMVGVPVDATKLPTWRNQRSGSASLFPESPLFALRSRAYIKYTLPKLKIKLYLHAFELCCQLLTFWRHVSSQLCIHRFVKYLSTPPNAIDALLSC